MLEFLQTGGLFMWPIFAFLIIALAVVMEKFFTLFVQQRGLNHSFKAELFCAISARDFERIERACKAANNSVARVLARILAERAHTANCAAAREYIYENAQSCELARLQKREFLLGTTVAICPQLGLLGTVIGMIASFSALAHASDQSLVAGGISQALYTTAFGLIVAIFALIFHVIYGQKIDALSDEIYLFASALERADRPAGESEKTAEKTAAIAAKKGAAA